MYVPILNLTGAALPSGAGNWITNGAPVPLPETIASADSTTITFGVTYTKGGSSSNGYPKLRLVWIVTDGNGSDVEHRATVVDEAITITGSSSEIALEKAYLRETGLAALTNANPGTIEVSFEAPRWGMKVRVEAAEAGDVTHPGTITVAYLGRK